MFDWKVNHKEFHFNTCSFIILASEILKKRGIDMQCGAKCFYVELEVEGKLKTETVVARTPINARKTIRHTYGKEPRILKVTKKKR